MAWSAPTSLTPIGYTIALGTIDDPYLMDAIDVSSTSHTFTMDESVTSFRTITPYHLVSNTSYRVFVRARYANPSGGEYHGHWREAEFSGTFRYSQDSCVIVATAADETTGILPKPKQRCAGCVMDCHQRQRILYGYIHQHRR